MRKTPPEVQTAAHRLHVLDKAELRGLQLLAVSDPELRYAFSDVWSIAVRCGIDWADDVTKPLPDNPFSTVGMQAAGCPPAEL